MAAGSFTSTQLTADDAVLSRLRVGDKYYKCTSDGDLGFFSSRAYGIFDFSFFKADPTTGSTLMKFISLDQLEPATSDDGYVLNYALSGLISFTKYSSGVPASLFLTAVGYLSTTTATWYSFRVQRADNGTFSVLVKGGDLGDEYIIVPVSTGSNPVLNTTFTRSMYMVFNMDAGDVLMWTPDERITNSNIGLYGANPIVVPVPKTSGAVALNSVF